ncbi:unnamed protein product [Protopolystoma xenopodis]|uniref:Uncharacterized protein n=1 Tax=Protopolystoma xenopodis TaxID=117903 RepID=A0A3S5C2G1_9PLAT|nr:unnamed protein product [Protopolystoma xenopodis]
MTWLLYDQPKSSSFANLVSGFETRDERYWSLTQRCRLESLTRGRLCQYGLGGGGPYGQYRTDNSTYRPNDQDRQVVTTSARSVSDSAIASRVPAVQLIVQTQGGRLFHRRNRRSYKACPVQSSATRRKPAGHVASALACKPETVSASSLTPFVALSLALTLSPEFALCASY